MDKKPIRVCDYLDEGNRNILWTFTDKTTLIVKYPRARWSKKAFAWYHLQKEPPSDAVTYLQQLKDLFDTPGLQNPWREDHEQEHFVWRLVFRNEQELQELVRSVNSQEVFTFDPKVWRSTSNKYRAVARLPEGMTAVQAMEKYFPEEHQEILRRIEDAARRQFLRVYSDKVQGCHAELTEAEWIRFKKEGGQSA